MYIDVGTYLNCVKHADTQFDEYIQFENYVGKEITFTYTCESNDIYKIIYFVSHFYDSLYFLFFY